MILIYAVCADTDVDDVAFRVFANIYPHEAAKLDWLRFFAVCKERNAALTEDVVRRMLAGIT